MVSDSYIKAGSLVYIPSGVTMYSYVDDSTPSWIKKYNKINKPIVCALVSSGTVGHRMCVVLYNGERWLVKVSDAYEVKGENLNLGERLC